MARSECEKHLFGILTVLMLLLLPIVDAAAETSEATRITSRKMTYNQADNTVDFQGEVHVVHPEIEIWADRIMLYLKKDEVASGQQALGAAVSENADVDRIVALGNVRFAKDERTGRCGKATYLYDEGLLLLEENPVLTEGKNTLQGELIRIYLKENRSEVVGGEDQPVEMIFVTPEKSEKNGKDAE